MTEPSLRRFDIDHSVQHKQSKCIRLFAEQRPVARLRTEIEQTVPGLLLHRLAYGTHRPWRRHGKAIRRLHELESGMRHGTACQAMRLKLVLIGNQIQDHIVLSDYIPRLLLSRLFTTLSFARSDCAPFFTILVASRTAAVTAFACTKPLLPYTVPFAVS